MRFSSEFVTFALLISWCGVAAILGFSGTPIFELVMKRNEWALVRRRANSHSFFISLLC